MSKLTLMAKQRKPATTNPYLKGLRRADDNFNGLISNGGFSQFSGGGWMNLATGLGTFGRDKVMQASFIDSLRITDPELAALFHGNDLAARIVEGRPNEMFRRGYDLCIPDPEGDKIGQNKYAELAAEISDYAEELRVDEMCHEGMIWGRLFGGDLTIIGADDGQDMAEPLNEENIKSIRYLNNVDRRFLFAHTYYSDPFDLKFGEVETYQVTNAFGDQQNSIVHETRVLRWDGSKVDILKRRMLAGWTLSVLQRPYDVLRAFDSSFQAASNLVVDMSQAVFKLNGLMEQISSGEVSALQTRMSMVDMNRSAGRAILLDNENEEFERMTTPMSGLAETLDRFMQRLASAANMPVTILFGREPAGLNATGEADFRHWYDSVASEQKKFLEPPLLRIYNLICLAKDGPTGGKPPESGLEIHWIPLRQPDEMEQAEIYGKMATADSAYITATVLLPQEVALSRFRGGKFRLETEIDVDARKESMKADLELHVDTAKAKAEQGPVLMPAEGEPSNPQQAPPGAQGSKQDNSSGRAP